MKKITVELTEEIYDQILSGDNMKKITVELTEEIYDQILLTTLKDSYESERFGSLFGEEEWAKPMEISIGFAKPMEKVLRYYMSDTEFNEYMETLKERTLMKTVYIAEDGIEFFNQQDCIDYEKKFELVEFIKKNITLTFQGETIGDIITHIDVENFILKHYNELGTIIKKMGKK